MSLKAVKKEAQESEDVLDFGLAAERPPLIPDGTYEVAYTRASKKFWCFGSDHVLLFSKILNPGDYHDKEIYLPVRVEPSKGMKGMSMSSKIVRSVTIALGHSPTRNDRLTTKVFHGKAFRASVRTVTHDAKKKPLHVANLYSRIDSLLEKTVG